MKSVTELYGAHPGSDIYVVGTGASLRVFPVSFLADRITIGLNMAWAVVPVRYGITVHPDLNIPDFIPGETPRPEITWIVKRTKMEGMDPAHIAYAEANLYGFRTGRRPGDPVPPPGRPGTDPGARVLEYVRRPTDDYLYVWSSISQPAVNLAANMGARNVILVGCDNAALLGNHHSHAQHTRWLGAAPDERYRDYYDGLAEMRTVLRERGVNLVSLNPFLSIGPHEHDFAQLCQELDLPLVIENEDISESYVSPWKAVPPVDAGLVVRTKRAARGYFEEVRRRASRPAKPGQDALDLVAVVAEQNRGWVLDTIARQVVDHFDGDAALHYVPAPAAGERVPPLPPARTYFFTHYLIYRRHLEDRHAAGARTLVFYTHPRYTREEAPAVGELLRGCSLVVSMSGRIESLLAIGVPRASIAVAIPGVDPGRFVPHGRGHGAVGLCSAYYERKSPDRIVEIIAAMPHRTFRLLGPGWRDAPVYERLAELPNFEHLELAYDDYPSFYAGIDVFVSPSSLEGGPIPLLEAMMANAVPVATRTGFAPDLVRDGENGFLCDVDAPTSVFAERIDRAYLLDVDVRATVEHYTVEAFAAKIGELARG